MHLFYNAQIHTLYGNQIADWLLSDQGKIIALGDPLQRPAHFNNSQKTDLNGATVLPAFTDGHSHLVTTALAQNRIQLDGITSLSQVCLKLKEYAQRFKKNEWIRGGGFNKNIWPDGKPHKAVLDEIFPYNPVALESKDFHSMWLNSVALKKAGIKAHSPDPQGGKYERDNLGKLTGIVYERALNHIYQKIDLPDQKTISTAVKKISQEFFSNGITSVHTMEGIAELQALNRMDQSNQLDLRVHSFVPKDQLTAELANNLQDKYESAKVHVAGVKFFTDGSLGSQTAHMLKPYAGTTNLGISHISAEELNEQVSFFNRIGLSAAVHAIGDAAVKKTLDAFAYSRSKGIPESIHNRLEHAQLIPADQIMRFRELNITASLQPIHIADDVLMAEKLWDRRCSQAYPIKSLKDAGVNLVFGSDTPVADFNPFKGIYSAMERRYRLDQTQDKWVPEQAVDLLTAIKAYTIGPAKSIGMPHLYGVLKSGLAADFIVLDRDIFRLPAEALLGTQVIQTILAGKPVYNQVPIN